MFSCCLGIRSCRERASVRRLYVCRCRCAEEGHIHRSVLSDPSQGLILAVGVRCDACRPLALAAVPKSCLLVLLRMLDPD